MKLKKWRYRSCEVGGLPTANIDVDKRGRVNIGYIHLRASKIVETVSTIATVNLDYDKRGRIVGFEIV